jgi:hypothetical protein
MDSEKLDRLYSARRDAQDALNAHFEKLRIAIGYGDPPHWEWLGKHPDWLGEHRRLREARDSAEEHLFRYLQGEEAST